MSKPFRVDNPPSLYPLYAIFEALEDLEGADALGETFQRSLADQLDRAIFVLTGEGPATAFKTDATLPDPRRTGSVLDKINKTHDRMESAIREVLENSGSYPIHKIEA